MLKYALLLAALELVRSTLTSKTAKDIYINLSCEVIGTFLTDKIKSVKEKYLPSRSITLEKAAQESIKESLKEIVRGNVFDKHEKDHLDKLHSEVETLFPLDNTQQSLLSEVLNSLMSGDESALWLSLENGLKASVESYYGYPTLTKPLPILEEMEKTLPKTMLRVFSKKLSSDAYKSAWTTYQQQIFKELVTQLRQKNDFPEEFKQFIPIIIEKLDRLASSQTDLTVISELTADIFVRVENLPQQTERIEDAIKTVIENDTEIKTKIDALRNKLDVIAETTTNTYEEVVGLRQDFNAFAQRQDSRNVFVSNEPEPFLCDINLDEEIIGREDEYNLLLQAMRDVGGKRVLCFTAPGGFGKTALLTKLLQDISANEAGNKRRITEQAIRAIWQADCRNGVGMFDIFSQTGRLVGKQEAFQNDYQLYQTSGDKTRKIQTLLDQLSDGHDKTVWIAFDNFETLLDQGAKVVNEDLREFFNAIFAGNHSVRLLLVSRTRPDVFIRHHERFLLLEEIGDKLFDGLPLEDCVAYLNNNGATEGLRGSDEEITDTLERFAKRVHQIPMALKWAVGFLADQDRTLKELLEDGALFSDFDKAQHEDKPDYLEKGLKRLHYEQLKAQPQQHLPILALLALFKRYVPRAVFGYIPDHSKTLTTLVKNKLASRRESQDPRIRAVADDSQRKLYALHPVICENDFFKEISMETSQIFVHSAASCLNRADVADEQAHYAHTIALYDCAISICEFLINEKTPKVELDLAFAFIGKGNALANLNNLMEAIECFDNAIKLYEWYRQNNVIDESEVELAVAYMNKGCALFSLSKFDEAIVFSDKAIEILIHWVRAEDPWAEVHLAQAYANKSNSLIKLNKPNNALHNINEAIEILERLVTSLQNVKVESDLARAYVSKGLALAKLDLFDDCIVQFDKAADKIEQLISKGFLQFRKESSIVYINKGVAFFSQKKLCEAIECYDKAIIVLEELKTEGRLECLEDLATAYRNKAEVLNEKNEIEKATECYSESIRLLKTCVFEFKWNHFIPTLVMSIRLFLAALIKLERLTFAAKDFLLIFNLIPLLGSDQIPDSIKQMTEPEFARLLFDLCKMPAESREKLYEACGENAEVVRATVENFCSNLSKATSSDE